jgi:hypothetical protein
MDIHLYFPGTYTVHIDSGSADQKLDQLLAQGVTLVMASTEIKLMLGRIDVATNNIADDVRRLTASATKPGGLTPEETTEVQSLGDAIATRLESIAASTEDPVPDAPPMT